MEIHRISRKRYAHTILWATAVGCAVMVAVAGLGRARLNLDAALVEKPDIAVALLLPEEEISSTEVLKEEEGLRVYLAETKNGPKLITLKKGEEEWYVEEVVQLHE